MKLTFIGATHEVTGSCYYLEACEQKILIDCGMEQGMDLYENQKLPVAAADINYVFLTHAHIDHSGMLPDLYSKGFRGKILATGATCQLCDIMLRDSAHIQMMEAEWRNKKKKPGEKDYVPLYDMDDAIGAVSLFEPYHYNEMINVAPGIRIRFVDCGHMLGSSSIEILIHEDQVEKKIVFSGDIGNFNQALIRDPQYIKSADYVVMESTYGDRSHSVISSYLDDLTKIIQNTLDRGGNVVIPSFAIGRAQEILYFMRQIKQDHLISGHDHFPVYLDSPLAVEASEIFSENTKEYFDQDAMVFVNQGINPIIFDDLIMSVTTDESKAINFDDRPKVIISASGMCDAGRIKHHLRYNLERPESTILFVGYQAKGTLGRSISDGAPKIHLFGEEVYIKAKISQIEGFSSHADNNGLIAWINHFEENPQKVFICHGEDTVCDLFAERLSQEFGHDTYAPFSGARYDLANNVLLSQGVRVRIASAPSLQFKKSAIFERLLAAGNRLIHVIHENEAASPAEMTRLADQINTISDRWEK